MVAPILLIFLRINEHATPFVGYDGDPFGTGVYVYVDGEGS